jgi:hypothetical protein
MKKKHRLPFQGMTIEAWQNLALVAMLTFYVIIFGFALIKDDFCASVGIDYCAYYSAGRIANERDMADIYDLEILTQYQEEIYPQASGEHFQTFAIMYLPVFVLPFMLFSLVNLPTSFILWSILNLLVFAVYLRFFIKEAAGSPLPLRLAMMVMLALPVFQNLFFGQVSIWLGIFAGEFMRALISDKPYRAGLWLAGWLLKPQLLILILPLLLLQRSVKVLAGFMLLSITILAISIGLVGMDGFLNLTSTLLEAGSGGVHSMPQVMMNWRMLGWHIESFSSSIVGWTVVAMGTLLTACVALFVFRKKIEGDSTKRVVALLGVFAATSAIAWHAHFHMSIILIPPMVYLVVKNRFNQKLFLAWLFVPALLQFLFFVLQSVLNLYTIPALVEGLQGLIFNLLILGWGIDQFVNDQKDTNKVLSIASNKK